MAIGTKNTRNISPNATRYGMRATSVQWKVAQRLADFRPLRAVCGNCDGGDLRLMFGEKLRWRCEEADVLMTHIGGYPGRYAPGIRHQLYERPPQLFICGHSHILKIQFDPKLGLLHINPGAAGLMGWHKVRTLVRFTVDGCDFKDLEVVEIPRKGGEEQGIL